VFVILSVESKDDGNIKTSTAVAFEVFLVVPCKLSWSSVTYFWPSSLIFIIWCVFLKNVFFSCLSILIRDNIKRIHSIFINLLNPPFNLIFQTLIWVVLVSAWLASIPSIISSPRVASLSKSLAACSAVLSFGSFCSIPSNCSILKKNIKLLLS